MKILNIVIGGMQNNQAIKKDGVCTTLVSAMGTGGGYVPMIVLIDEKASKDKTSNKARVHTL